MAIIRATCLNKIHTSSNFSGLFKKKETAFQALKNFDLEIEKPMIYGLVGPNGAGKTTFIKHCLGLSKQTSGSLEVLGFCPFQSRQGFLRQISLISGNHQAFESRLSARELLKFQGALYNLPKNQVEIRSQELIDLFKIEDKLDLPLERLSLGQKMKFEIISKVLHSPKLLFLDEPTLGLDFEAQNMMHELLLGLHQKEKMTILLTSHYLPDITKLCSKFTVIENGENVFTGTFAQLDQINETNQTSGQEGYLKSLIQELSTAAK